MNNSEFPRQLSEVVSIAVDTSSRTILPNVSALANAASILDYQDPDEVSLTSTRRVHETVLDWLNGRKDQVYYSGRPQEVKERLTERLLRA